MELEMDFYYIIINCIIEKKKQFVSVDITIRNIYPTKIAVSVLVYYLSNNSYIFI